MNEYMLLIKNQGDGKAGMKDDEHLAFVKACEVYISKLKAKDLLIAAKPLIRKGVTLKKNGSEWQETSIDFDGIVQVGYYHIYAKDIEHAAEIAKENPEFNYVKGASVEIRPLKLAEKATGFKYPGKA
jgi:hypothetical protein